MAAIPDRPLTNRTRVGRQAKVLPGQSRDLAQQYLDIVGVILVALDADGNITLLNRKGHEVLEYPEGSLLGKNWIETCLPERERARVASIVRQLMAGEIQASEHVENAVLTRSGGERIIAWHNTLLRDKAGECVGTLSSGEDITDRKRAEEALRQSEERFRSVVETSPDAIVLCRSRRPRADGQPAGGFAGRFQERRRSAGPRHQRLRFPGAGRHRSRRRRHLPARQDEYCPERRVHHCSYGRQPAAGRNQRRSAERRRGKSDEHDLRGPRHHRPQAGGGGAGRRAPRMVGLLRRHGRRRIRARPRSHDPQCEPIALPDVGQDQGGSDREQVLSGLPRRRCSAGGLPAGKIARDAAQGRSGTVRADAEQMAGGVHFAHPRRCRLPGQTHPRRAGRHRTQGVRVQAGAGQRSGRSGESGQDRIPDQHQP